MCFRLRQRCLSGEGGSFVDETGGAVGMVVVVTMWFLVLQTVRILWEDFFFFFLS